MLKPLLNRFHKVGVTANAITWTAILLSTAIGAMFWFFPNGHMLWVFAVGLLVRMALNTFDGMMARMSEATSASGEILNELGDVLCDVVMYCPLIMLPGVNFRCVLLFIFLAMLNEFTGVLSKAATGSRRYDGPMGKSDRALILAATCLLFFFWPGVMAAFDYVFAGMSVLLVLGSTIRIKNGLAQIGS